MQSNILTIENVSKDYQNTKALDNVSMEIKKGEIYGLIGRNGAGKTTLFRIISGLIFPSAGKVLLFNEELDSAHKTSNKIGVLIENPGLYPNLNAYDNLELKCLAYGVGDKLYIHHLLQMVGLGTVSKKKVKEFSLGMKQRLGIALALVGDPELLILDEPVTGLDPQGIKEIRDMLVRLNKEKEITIIVSSHILGELSLLATRFGIINKGRLIEEINKSDLIVKTKDRLEISVNDVDKAVTILESELKIKNVNIINKEIIHVFEQLDASGEINRILNEKNVIVNSLSVNSQSLEEYFIKLTGGDYNA